MFSNRLQVAQVCRVLTQGIVREVLFTPDGPSAAARKLAASSGVSGGDKAILELALWFWEDAQCPRLSQLIELLDRTRLRMVGTLLLALSEGAPAIERWLKSNGGPVGQA